MRRIFSIVCFVFLSVLHTGLFAGPTIIRDKRISDLALTPTLGRGYTMVTNTFQSKCLDNIVLTDPSYDFKYTFRSLETSDASDLRIASKLGLAVPVKVATVGAGASVSAGVKQTETTQHIYVEINMDTYYASVDETRTQMGASAAELLSNDDIPGFFSSCGSYYVRSLGRNAKFISIYSYTTKSTQRDASFEAGLKASIMKFGGGCSSKDACEAPTSSTTAAEEGESKTSAPDGSGVVPSGAGVSAGAGMSLMQKADEYQLTITASAYGLGKNEGATLISYDIETFKAAIKDAFISMQNPMTGKVTTMEIVPWVENTDFQNLIELEEEVADPITNETMLLYKKKQILNENAEFLAELERADRNMMNIYYKSKICQETVRANWMKDGEIHPDFKDAEIANNKFPREKMKLAKLISEHLNKTAINKLLEDENKFMYASGGANECISSLLKSGMFVKSYRDIKVCKDQRDKMVALINDTVDNYCMPELVKPFVIQASDQVAEIKAASSEPATKSP